MKEAIYTIYKKSIRLFEKKQNFNENIELKKLFGNYKRAIILGSAQSINDLELKRFSNDFVITMGNFHEHAEINEIVPKMHIFAASHPPLTNSVLLKWWSRCHNLLPKTTMVLVEKRDRTVAEMAFKGRKVFYYSYGGTLPIDFTKPIMSPWSVTIVALQLAIYCKIKTIGILGVNHDWQCIKPYLHFYDHIRPSLEYYLEKENIKISYEQQKPPLPKERLYREYELFQQYEVLKKEAEANGLTIHNADPFSTFDVFPFNTFDHIIKPHKFEI